MKDFVNNGLALELAGLNMIEKEASPAHKSAWIVDRNDDAAKKAVKNALPILQKYAPALAKKFAAESTLRFSDLSPLEQAKFNAAEAVSALGKDADNRDKFGSLRREQEHEIVAEAQSLLSQKYFESIAGEGEIDNSSFNSTHTPVQLTLGKIEKWADPELVEELKELNSDAYKQFLFDIHGQGQKCTKKFVETAMRRATNDPSLIHEEKARKIQQSLTQDTIDVLAEKIREPLMIAGIKKEGQSYANDDNAKRVAKFLLVHMPEALVRVQQELDENAKKHQARINIAKELGLATPILFSDHDNNEELSATEGLLAKLGKRMSLDETDFEEDVFFAITEQETFKNLMPSADNNKKSSVIENLPDSSQYPRLQGSIPGHGPLKLGVTSLRDEKHASLDDDTPVVLAEPRRPRPSPLRLTSSQRIYNAEIIPFVKPVKQELRAGTSLNTRKRRPILNRAVKVFGAAAAKAAAFTLAFGLTAASGTTPTVDQGNVISNAVLNFPVTAEFLPSDIISAFNVKSMAPSIDEASVSVALSDCSQFDHDPLNFTERTKYLACKQQFNDSSPTETLILPKMELNEFAQHNVPELHSGRLIAGYKHPEQSPNILLASYGESVVKNITSESNLDALKRIEMNARFPNEKPADVSQNTDLKFEQILDVITAYYKEHDVKLPREFKKQIKLYNEGVEQGYKGRVEQVSYAMTVMATQKFGFDFLNTHGYKMLDLIQEREGKLVAKEQSAKAENYYRAKYPVLKA